MAIYTTTVPFKQPLFKQLTLGYLALLVVVLLQSGLLLLPVQAHTCGRKQPHYQHHHCGWRTTREQSEMLPTVRRFNQAQQATQSFTTPAQAYQQGQYWELNQTEDQWQRLAFQAYLASAQGGDSRGAYRVAQLYEQGVGTPRDVSQAVYWYQQSADNRAKYRLAQLAEYATGMPYSPQKAINYYAQAAESGDGRATYRLAQNYQPNTKSLPLTESNTDQALYWLEESARSGDGRAQYQLARAYHVGQSPVGKQNLILARDWYQQSALQAGDTRSMYYLGQLYEFGGVGLQNTSKAYAWYRIAKEAGHGWATPALVRVTRKLQATGQLHQGVNAYKAIKAQ
jgi:TPR repeat protein